MVSRRDNHEQYVEHLVLNLTSDLGAARLASKSPTTGLRLRRLLAFDGLPQHFPTSTNGFHPQCNPSKRVSEGKFPGWREEYGRSCVGPLPPNSPQKAAMLLGRHAFERHSTDAMTTTGSSTNHDDDQHRFNMSYYGRVWEFANQYWWQMEGEKKFPRGSRLDCTHYRRAATAEGWQVHKYFVQAMIDDEYFE